MLLDTSPIDWDRPLVWVANRVATAGKHNFRVIKAELVSRNAVVGTKTGYALLCHTWEDKQEVLIVDADGWNGLTENGYRVVFNYVDTDGVIDGKVENLGKF
jgi:hypothetical protein